MENPGARPWSQGRLDEGAPAPKRHQALVIMRSSGVIATSVHRHRLPFHPAPTLSETSVLGSVPVRSCRVFRQILTAPRQISPRMPLGDPERLRAARSGGVIIADEPRQIPCPRLDRHGGAGAGSRQETGLAHPDPGGTATRPVGGVAFRTGFVRVVTGFGNEEVRAVTGFGNDDVKAVTGFGNQGSRVLQGSWTDAGGRDKGSPKAVEAGGVIIAWGRSASAAASKLPFKATWLNRSCQGWCLPTKNPLRFVPARPMEPL